MCVLSIKVPIQKKSGNLFNEPCNSNYRVFGVVIYVYHLLIFLQESHHGRHHTLHSSWTNLFLVD